MMILDVSLLAVLLAVHFSNNKDMQNFKLVVLAVLLAHVIFTTRKMYTLEDMIIENELQDEVTQEVVQEEVQEEVVQEETQEELGAPFVETGPLDKKRDDFSIESKAKSVADSEFRRSLTVPEKTIKNSTGRDVTKFFKDLTANSLEENSPLL